MIITIHTETIVAHLSDTSNGLADQSRRLYGQMSSVVTALQVAHKDSNAIYTNLRTNSEAMTEILHSFMEMQQLLADRPVAWSQSRACFWYDVKDITTQMNLNSAGPYSLDLPPRMADLGSYQLVSDTSSVSFFAMRSETTTFTDFFIELYRENQMGRRERYATQYIPSTVPFVAKMYSACYSALGPCFSMTADLTTLQVNVYCYNKNLKMWTSERRISSSANKVQGQPVVTCNPNSPLVQVLALNKAFGTIDFWAVRPGVSSELSFQTLPFGPWQADMQGLTLTTGCAYTSMAAIGTSSIKIMSTGMVRSPYNNFNYETACGRKDHDVVFYFQHYTKSKEYACHDYVLCRHITTSNDYVLSNLCYKALSTSSKPEYRTGRFTLDRAPITTRSTYETYDRWLTLDGATMLTISRRTGSKVLAWNIRVEGTLHDPSTTPDATHSARGLIQQ